MALKPEVTNYIEKLALTYGLDKDALLKKAESDEAAAKLIDEGVLLRSDYSRNQDKLKADFDSWKSGYYEKEVLPRWNDLSAKEEKARQEANQSKAEAAAYKALYGNLDGFQPANPQPVAATTVDNSWMTKDRYEADLSMTRQVAALSGREFSRVGLRYMKDFNDVLDMDAFDKHLQDGGYLKGAAVQDVPKAVTRAYEDFARPKIEAKAAAERDVEIKRQVDEGVQNELTKRFPGGLPMDTTGPNFRGSPIFHKPDEGEALLNDPNVPQWQKDEVLRNDFLKTTNGGQLTGALFAGR